MTKQEKSYCCSGCGNYWRKSEGYNPKTKQCKGCDDYDKEEPKRRLERKRLNSLPDINFPYVPGDPFW
jgi:hypothetical protein